MPKIKGPITSENIGQKLVDTGVSIKLPFSAVGFQHTKSIGAVKLKDKDGKGFKPTKVAKKDLGKYHKGI